MAVPLRYNLRNMAVRKVTTLMTVGGIALVTAIFVGLFALAIGLDRTLVGTGHPLNLIVLRGAGATETASTVTKQQAQDLASLEGIAKDAAGEPLVSPECVVVAGLIKEDGGRANIAVRGVGPKGRAVRDGILLREGGRWFQPGLGELVVGENARRRFSGLNVGDRPTFRGRAWKIVGVFTADGQAYESELWGDVEDIRASYKREYTAAIVRCADAATVTRLANVIRDDKQIRLDARPHTLYYQEQNMAGMMLKAMGVVMGLVLSIGAVFGAANTMYAAVSSRTKEIATMRVLGFSRGSIWLSFLFEALLLGLAGGVAGSLLAYLALNGVTQGTANWQTFSEIAFQFRVTPGLMGVGVMLAVLMGVGGGFFPAFRASRAAIVNALRGG